VGKSGSPEIVNRFGKEFRAVANQHCRCETARLAAKRIDQDDTFERSPAIADRKRFPYPVPINSALDANIVPAVLPLAVVPVEIRKRPENL
jgi:hypothetical protein